MDALRRSWQRATESAAMAVVVDAKDEAAAAFYQQFDFTALLRDPRLSGVNYPELRSR